MSPPRPAHVLLVDSSGYEDLGGASTVLNEIIERVDRSRFIPVLACLSPGSWPEIVRSQGTAAYSFPRSRLRSPRNLMTLVLGLRTVVRREQIALIHASENSALLYASLAGRMTRTPVIWHIHSPLQPRARSEQRRGAIARVRPSRPHRLHVTGGTPADHGLCGSPVLGGDTRDRPRTTPQWRSGASKTGLGYPRRCRVCCRCSPESVP